MQNKSIGGNMKKGMGNKIIVICTISLLFLATIPLVSGNLNIKNIKELEPRTPIEPKGIYDNFLIETRGPYLFDIIMLLITQEPVPFIETLIVNNYDHTVTIEPQFKVVATGENRILDEFQAPDKKMTPGYGSVYFLYDQYRWKNWDYTFGTFDYTLELHVQETDSDIKVVFHGFVFGIGVIIFNKQGKGIQ